MELKKLLLGIKREFNERGLKDKGKSGKAHEFWHFAQKLTKQT